MNQAISNNTQKEFELSVVNGNAYEVVADISAQSYNYSVGDIVVSQSGLEIGRKSNLQSGTNRFVFYATKTGLVNIKLIPSVMSDKACVTSLALNDIGEGIKESKDISKLKVVAAVASIPSRVSALKDCVESIYSQVDRLFVYLNGYNEIPTFLRDKKIEVVLDLEGRNAAAAKLFWISKVNAYYFTIDDDIIYPKDYCQKTIERYRDKALGSVVSYHGKNLSIFASNQRTDRKEFYPFESHLSKCKRAHVLGTGVMMIDTRLIKLPLFEIASQHPKAIDLAVSIYLRKNGIKRIVLKRDSCWIIQNTKVRHGLNELKQLVRQHANDTNRQVRGGRPWVESRLASCMIQLLMIPLFPFLKLLDRNKKLKKLIRNPSMFFKDSKKPIIRKIISSKQKFNWRVSIWKS